VLPVILKTRTIRFRLRTEFRRFRSFRRSTAFRADFAALAAGTPAVTDTATENAVNDSNSGNSDAGLQDQLTKVLAERDHALASRNFQGAIRWCSRSASNIQTDPSAIARGRNGRHRPVDRYGAGE